MVGRMVLCMEWRRQWPMEDTARETSGSDRLALEGGPVLSAAGAVIAQLGRWGVVWEQPGAM